MVKTVIWMSFLPQIASVCSCECAVSEVWTCFRFDRICFRERAQNQKVSCHVECIVSMVKKEK